MRALLFFCLLWKFKYHKGDLAGHCPIYRNASTTFFNPSAYLVVVLMPFIRIGFIWNAFQSSVVVCYAIYIAKMKGLHTFKRQVYHVHDALIKWPIKIKFDGFNLPCNDKDNSDSTRASKSGKI